jgi:phosphoribosylformylglycinamidine (FGAM) synthase-like enzyme
LHCIKEAERHLEEGGLSYQWNTDDSLFYWRNLPATIHHPNTGEKVWFNQATAHHCTYLKFSPMFDGITFESDSQYPTHTTYGDGTEIEPEVIQHIRKIDWQCTVGFPWKNSDMLVVDNLKAMHARLSYTGKRRILVYMSSE